MGRDRMVEDISTTSGTVHLRGPEELHTANGLVGRVVQVGRSVVQLPALLGGMVEKLAASAELAATLTSQ